MIAKLNELKEKFSTLNRSVLTGIEDSFKDNDSIVEDLNISQLQRGERSDGVILPDYSPRSVQEFGKPPGPIRLFDTGAFYRGITLTAASDAATLSGRDRKTRELQDDYGDEIIGLTEENKKIFRDEYLKIDILDTIKKVFNADGS